MYVLQYAASDICESRCDLLHPFQCRSLGDAAKPAGVPDGRVVGSAREGVRQLFLAVDIFRTAARPGPEDSGPSWRSRQP